MTNIEHFKEERYTKYKYGVDSTFNLIPDWETWDMTYCPSNPPPSTTTTTTTSTTTAITTPPTIPIPVK